MREGLAERSTGKGSSAAGATRALPRPTSGIENGKMGSLESRVKVRPQPFEDKRRRTRVLKKGRIRERSVEAVGCVV